MREKIYDPALNGRDPSYHRYHAEPLAGQDGSCWEKHQMELEIAQTTAYAAYGWHRLSGLVPTPRIDGLWSNATLKVIPPATIHAIVQEHIAHSAALVNDPMRMSFESNRLRMRLSNRMYSDPSLAAFTPHFAQALVPPRTIKRL